MTAAQFLGSSGSTEFLGPNIPRVLHQIFFGGPDAVPDSYRAYAATWRANHPEWTYEFWDAKRCRDLLVEHYPWFLPIYDAYRHRIQRVDAIRYFILYHHGGVYADMDIESLKPIDDLIENRVLLLGALRIGFTNAVMGSAPGHPLWPAVFDTLRQRRHRFARNAPLWSKLTMPMQIGYSTGPVMLSDCLQRTGYANGDDPKVNICASYVFEPLAPRADAPPSPDGKVDLTGSYAIHHMSMHWLPKQHRFMSWLLGIVARPFVRKNGQAPP
jgi:mannosyltransferase OCH1-like enzyme